MSRDRRQDDGPRVGLNDEEGFLGAPLERPRGLNPFTGHDDSSEGEVALEMLPQMARVTSSHQPVPVPPRSRALYLAAVLLMGAILIASYLVFAR